MELTISKANNGHIIRYRGSIYVYDDPFLMLQALCDMLRLAGAVRIERAQWELGEGDLSDVPQGDDSPESATSDPADS